jgi:hypothetical protein
MAQVVSRWPLTKEAQVNPCGIYGGQIGTETGFSPSPLLFLSVSFHCGSPYSHIIWGMNIRSVGGRSSET